MFVFLVSILFNLFSGLARTYTYLYDLWIELKYSQAYTHRPVARYYLSNEHIPFEETLDRRVFEDCVYVEEWVDRKGNKKCSVLYEGEIIPQSWTNTPFDIPDGEAPWVWIGDLDTEIDLTRTLNKFLIPGNRIELDLLCNLIQVTERTEFMYIEAGTFKEVKFPNEGITIEARDDS